MTPRDSAGFSDFVQFAIWPKRGPRDMRYGRYGRVGAPVRERAKPKKSAHKMTSRRPKNIFPGISGATER